MVRQGRQQAGGTRGSLRGMRALGLAATTLLLLSMLLTACASDAQQTAARQNKSKLDTELHHARTDLGLPDSLLQPITSQENKIASGEGGWSYNYTDAASNYALLYNQLVGIEQTAGQTLKTQTAKDLDAFTQALKLRDSQGFTEISAYQARLNQAQKDLTKATTPGDYAKIDAVVRAQTEALNSLWPAYQKLQDFKATLRAMRAAGINSSLGETEYNADVQAFRDASTAARYEKLVGVIDGQIVQMMADQTEALPFIGTAMLDAFQARIDLLHQYGENAKAFQSQHDADTKDLASASALTDYLTLAQVINKQTSAMELPLVRGKARYDLASLRHLIDTAQAQNPLSAYEYASGDVGVGTVADELNGSASLADYQNADNDITIMTTNLRALLDNLHDTTPSSQPHAVDLQLMQHYGIMSGRVVMVSLREQVARFYENGKLVYWSYVTTGRPEKPSPPGFHTAMDKEYHIEFKSGDPQGSALWYAPTPINYAILYANYGFFLHDAYWRAKFGPGSNLPHPNDGLAFNDGSHGCINFPEINMAWVWDWTPLYSPIVVY